MNEYSIEISNGKAACDSAFYIYANDLLSKECKRLCSFTEELDKDTTKKKEHIAEYKCAKFRYSTVGRISKLLYYGNYVYRTSPEYVHLDIENSLQSRPELLSIVQRSNDEEKIDLKLYYGISAIARDMQRNLEEKLAGATAWEKVELEERIGGLQFAEECLNEAWSRRKDVIK